MAALGVVLVVLLGLTTVMILLYNGGPNDED